MCAVLEREYHLEFGPSRVLTSCIRKALHAEKPQSALIHLLNKENKIVESERTNHNKQGLLQQLMKRKI